MIKSFKNRALKRLFERDMSAGIPPELRNKIKKILLFLDSMDDPKGVNLPHWRLHRLKGDRKDQWAVDVSGNWRIVFRFTEGRVEDVDFIDYH